MIGPPPRVPRPVAVRTSITSFWATLIFHRLTPVHLLYHHRPYRVFPQGVCIHYGSPPGVAFQTCMFLELVSFVLLDSDPIYFIYHEHRHHVVPETRPDVPGSNVDSLAPDSA